MRTARRTNARLLIAPLALAALPACYTETGPAFNFTRDQHVYVSRHWEPKTVTLYDTRTDEVLWSVDVPVGYKVVVDFERGDNQLIEMPDKMIWDVMPETSYFGTLRQELPCPPATSRRIEFTLRERPEGLEREFPEGDVPARLQMDRLEQVEDEPAGRPEGEG
jgi:hypothetical protein